MMFETVKFKTVKLISVKFKTPVLKEIMQSMNGVSLLRIMVCLLGLMWSTHSFSAQTYITQGNVNVYDSPNGNIVATWPERTLFTSHHQDNIWITVSGHFPEGEWQPLSPRWYILVDSPLQVRKAQSANAPATEFYTHLNDEPSKARAYKLLEPVMVYNSEGELQQEWRQGLTFTSAFQDENRIKVTGHFPDGNWQPLDTPLWLNKPVRLQDRSQPTMLPRDKTSQRMVVIDKNDFTMTLLEKTPEGIQAIMSSPVALGYDRCLPAEQGGKCYYTPEGEYQIEFKLFDTDGIKWCIPKKMEGEFADKIAKGQRCWRGIMGNHALHFGQSLFLHGTSNPNSIGSKTTHGCVRMRNTDIEMVYRLLTEGDRVIITSNYDDMIATLYAEGDETLTL